MRNGLFAGLTVLLLLGSLCTLTGCDDNGVLELPGSEDDNGNDDNNNNNGGSGDLESLNSTPSTGDAVFSNPTILYETNQGVDQLDVVRLSETVGSFFHEMDVYWVPGTGEVRSVQHAWGDQNGLNGASTGCWTGGTLCDPAQVSVDESAQVVTFANLLLPDSFGGASTSTLDGTVQW
jgi:hypothetical protein